MTDETPKPKWVNPVIIIGGVTASIFSIFFGAAHLKNRDSSHFRANAVMQCAAGGQVAVIGLTISETKTYGERVAVCLDVADVIYRDPVRDKTAKIPADFVRDAEELAETDLDEPGNPEPATAVRAPLKID